MNLSRIALAMGLLALGACSGGTPPNPCKPPVQGVVWDGAPDPAVSRQMQALYEADGADRSNPGITLAVMLANDEARRIEVMSYLQAGKLSAPADFFHAAAVFSRGTCSDHLELAVRLARHVWERGSAEAWRIYQQTGIRWMEAQGKKPRVEEGRLRSWPNLEDLNRRLWAKGDGTFAVPLRLPASLEPRRAELEAWVLAAQRRLREATKDHGWEQHFEQGFIDRVAVFESKTDLDRVVNQLRETAPTDPVDPFLSAELDYRALVVLSPEAAATLHPFFGGELGWEKLLTMAIARTLYQRLAGSSGMHGPLWFREGFAATIANVPAASIQEASRFDLQGIVLGSPPLEPGVCALLFKSVMGGLPLSQALSIPKQGPVVVDLDKLK